MDKDACNARKQIYVDRIIAIAECVIPGLKDASDSTFPRIPITFQRYTCRKWGWVGGFPQTHLFRAWGPKISPSLWMVRDSIFPGQSTVTVALDGLCVARSILRMFAKKIYPSRVATIAKPLYRYEG